MSDNQRVKMIKRSNVFQILTSSRNVLVNNWGELVSSTLLAVVSVLCLNLFPLFGFVMSFFASGFIALGYIGYVISLVKGKNKKIESIFTSFNNCLSAVALRLVMCAYVFLWSLLLIVPGIVASLNYSFAMSIMSDKKDVGAMDAIKESKKLVIGYRDVLFAIYLLAFLFMIIVFCFGLILPLSINAVSPLPIWSILTIAGVIALVVYGILFLPFFEVCLTSVYLEAKDNAKFEKKNNLSKRSKTSSTSANIAL